MKTLICLIFLLLIFKHAASVTEEEVDNFVNFINKNVEHSIKADLPLNNFKYKPDSDEIKEFGVFDFIIVGAGSTGTVIANRLSEVKNWKILLLEFGDFTDDFATMPAMIANLRFSRFNWGYQSVPQNYSCLGMNNKVCFLPRGRGVGGTSLINGQMYVRGHPIDFNIWEKIGNPGWSYKDVLPYFKKSENLNVNNVDAVIDWKYHHKGGPLNVEYNSPHNNPQLNAFYEGNQKMGFNFTDLNSPNQIGFAPVPLNVKAGRRFDGGTAFITPILKRKNLKVQTNSLVTKILISKVLKRASGVDFTFNRTKYRAYSTKEVIISAGAFNTPQLLMLSGIGPKKHLTEHGIKVIENLEVGSILREHPAFVGLFFSSNYSTPAKSFKEYIREYLEHKGPLTLSSGFVAVGFYKTKIENIKNYPDLELLFGISNCSSDFLKKGFNWNDETWDAQFKDLVPNSCFGIYPVALHVKSQGYVRLKNNDPYEFPIINPNHLSDRDNHDIDTLYEAIKFVMKMIETEPFKNINAKLAGKPLPACKKHKYLSKEYWYCALHQLTYNIYHPVGSCPMGPDPKEGAVVNHELRVHGIKKLIVADASVFPHTLSGHPNPPCVMIGEKLSDMLKKKYS